MFVAPSVLGALSALLTTQTPRVSLSADLNPQLQWKEDSSVTLRLYDDRGNFSRIRLGLALENGWHLRFCQKLARIPEDPDTSFLDEAYLEKPGEWGIGKQYVFLGTGRLYRESVMALQANTFIAFMSLPASISYVDNGPRRQRGIILRIGENLSLSAARGEHFGLNATALTPLRRPEEALPRGRGWRTLYNLSISQKVGGWTASAEFIKLQDGHSSEDKDSDILDVSLSYQFPYSGLLTGQFTLDAPNNRYNVWLDFTFPVGNKAFLVPAIRYHSEKKWQFSVSAIIRL